MWKRRNLEAKGGIFHVSGSLVILRGYAFASSLVEQQNSSQLDLMCAWTGSFKYIGLTIHVCWGCET